MTAALLNWRVWAAVCIAVALALAASHWKAYTGGQKQVQAQWNAERLDIARQTLRLIENNTRTSDDLQAKADNTRRNKNAHIARLDTDLAAALAGLRDRPDRPSAADLPANTSAGPAPGCTGAQLYRSDSQFLTREFDRAQRVLADLDECQTAHQSAREALMRWTSSASTRPD